MPVSKFIFIGDNTVLNSKYIVSVTAYGPESHEPSPLKIEIVVSGAARQDMYFDKVEDRDKMMRQLRTVLGNIPA